MGNGIEHAGHDQIREWLTLEPEPGPLLGREERRRLQEHLAGCSECRAERERLVRLDALLADAAVPLRGGFRAEVMAALPAAGWESRPPRAWRLPVAVLLVLAVAAGLLVGLSPAAAGPGGALSGAAGAVLDMVSTGLLAATGILWASWRGVGLALDAYLSPAAALALLILVASLDVLLLSLLIRRGRGATSGTAQRSRRR